ncbi:MAG: hypothetical protein OXH09_22180 [Gammaproteobacteria bacterium]|nr:hypothetical protein [Gammaproteobacteria bacterium]
MVDDERAKDVTIHVSDSALMHLLLAGMESYDVRLYGGKPIKRGKKKPVETAGLLWGYTVQRDDMDHVMVEHVSTDTYATRSYWDVELNDTVIDTKRQIIRDRWPHLLMIGDFHTHPYETYKDAKEVKGWEASPKT